MKDGIFLTIDVDWASDEVLDFALTLIEKHSLSATIFITHRTEMLERMFDNPKIEIGLHPNFIPLLFPDSRNLSGSDIHYSAENVLEALFELAPDATSVRTHALIAGSPLSELYRAYGLKVESSFFYNGKHAPDPYYDVAGMLRVYHNYADDCQFCYSDSGFEEKWSARDYLCNEGYKIFDFHPIHLFLNTETGSRYLEAKPYSQDFRKLRLFRNASTFGTHDFFLDLLECICTHNISTHTLSELLTDKTHIKGGIDASRE